MTVPHKNMGVEAIGRPPAQAAVRPLRTIRGVEREAAF
jgi:hypothetical protein